MRLRPLTPLDRTCLVLLSLGLAAGAAAKAPLELTTPEGALVVLQPQDDERALLVHFWATWCSECVAELPILEAATDPCAERGVRIVVVNVAEKLSDVESFLERHQLTSRVWSDADGTAWRSLRAHGLPTNLIWTAQARAVQIGARGREEWRTELAELGCPDPLN